MRFVTNVFCSYFILVSLTTMIKINSYLCVKRGVPRKVIKTVNCLFWSSTVTSETLMGVAPTANGSDFSQDTFNVVLVMNSMSTSPSPVGSVIIFSRH